MQLYVLCIHKRTHSLWTGVFIKDFEFIHDIENDILHEICALRFEAQFSSVSSQTICK